MVVTLQGNPAKRSCRAWPCEGTLQGLPLRGGVVGQSPAGSDGRLPALGFKGELLIIARNQELPELGISDMPDEPDILHLLHLLMVTDGDCEQQFIVLTPIQGTGGDDGDDTNGQLP